MISATRNNTIIVLVCFILKIQFSGSIVEAATIGVPTNPSQHQLIVETPTTSAKFSAINVRPETQSTEPLQIRQVPSLSRGGYSSGGRGEVDSRSFRVNLSDLRNRYARLENMITVLERVSYAISKPAAVIDAIRLFALAISSVLVTTLNVS